jgi:hypothetical protein
MLCGGHFYSLNKLLISTILSLKRWRNIMKKSLFIITLCFFCMVLYQTLPAQDIINELGGNTSNNKFYIVNSDGKILFVCTGIGYVGIGTETPGNNLDVIAPSGGDGISVSNGSGATRILMSIAGGDYGFIELHDTDDEINARFSPYGCYFDYPDSKVGIGESSGNANLEVWGTDGVLFAGTLESGSIPIEGPGTRMMWYPKKAAFRSGHILSDQWNDTNIGDYSTAMGYCTIASGGLSTALGYVTTASGYFSTAMGGHTTASGWYSTAMGIWTTASEFAATAMGSSTTASGPFSTAIGQNTTSSGDVSTAMGYATIASGDYSTAMGSYVKTEGIGSFIIGDNSTTDTLIRSGNNTFFARFNGGFRMYTDRAGEIGVFLNTGDVSWSPLSDSTKKENFKLADGEEILRNIAQFKLGTWNFIGQDPNKHRHYGPMAQDFYAAFGHDGIGTIGNDTTIASADFDGINFIAIQALEKRTTDLKDKISQLQQEIAFLREENILLRNSIANNERLREEILQLREVITNFKNTYHHKKVAADPSMEISLNQ